MKAKKKKNTKDDSNKIKIESMNKVKKKRKNLNE